MSYQQSASFVRALEDSQSLSTDPQYTIELPVVNMEVRAKPYVPEGGTAQDDYDQYTWFESPTFELTLMLEWGFERTDYRPSFLNTLQDLVAKYMNGNGPLDFYVKYTGSPTNYDETAYDTGYVCENMIPDISEDDAGIIFEEQARTKERSILLRSQSAQLQWGEVSFTYD